MWPQTQDVRVAKITLARQRTGETAAAALFYRMANIPNFMNSKRVNIYSKVMILFISALYLDFCVRAPSSSSLGD